VKTFRWFKALLAIGLVAGAVHAQAEFPDHPLRLIVPFPPGGATDLIGRAVAERLQAALGQPVVVDNRGGASGNIGVRDAVHAAPDGYTLVLGAPQTLTINPLLFTNLGFDPKRDLAPIVTVASVPNVLIVNKSLPVKSAKELAQYAKQHPGQLNYGSSSVGGTPHLSAELFKSMTGTHILHIPFKGSAPALQALIGGDIQMMFDNLPADLSFIRNGTIRALAVTSRERTKAAPDLPTMQEAGFKDFESEGWFALLAPAGTPEPILEKVNAAVNKALAAPDFRQRLENIGAEPVGGSRIDLRNRIEQESQRWARVIKFANIKAE
jgi:tripartite-type tricarboxylate transporter receptor subunit TctC